MALFLLKRGMVYNVCQFNQFAVGELPILALC